jgi:hypothetical protein
VRKAQALAPQLDPDIARAITEGNGPVIQAIANGAATDTQIAERLISMGLTTGLPPGVQQMVNEQMQLAADKREAECCSHERRRAQNQIPACAGMTMKRRAFFLDGLSDSVRQQGNCGRWYQGLTGAAGGVVLLPSVPSP